MSTWKVEVTHPGYSAVGGYECKGCEYATEWAVTTAKVTGSVGATHEDGPHVAKVTRVAEPEPSTIAHPVDCDCPRCDFYGYRRATIAHPVDCDCPRCDFYGYRRG